MYAFKDTFKRIDNTASLSKDIVNISCFNNQRVSVKTSLLFPMPS